MTLNVFGVSGHQHDPYDAGGHRVTQTSRRRSLRHPRRFECGVLLIERLSNSADARIAHASPTARRCGCARIFLSHN